MENKTYLFKMLKRLKNDKMLWAIFEAIGVDLFLIDSEKNQTIGYAKKTEKGFEIHLSPQSDLDFGFFVFCHEVMHCYFSHFNFVRKEKDLDNIAKDFAINYFLSDYLRYNIVTEDFIGVNRATIFKAFGVNLDTDLDSNEVYERLLNAPKQKQDLKNFCGTDTSESKASSNDRKILAEKLDSKLDDKALEKLAEIESKLNDTKNAKDRGDMALGIARPILEKRSGPASKEVTKIILNKAVNALKSLNTYKKSSRRDENLAGKVKQKQNRVCFVVDTSGSIGSKELKTVCSVIDSVSKNFEVTIRCGDTELQNEIKLKKGKKIDSLKFFRGGGGTDLNFAKQKGDNFLHYLIFTDGHIPEFKEKFKRTLFIFEGYDHLENEKCFTLKD
jgi:predicted metal-dependent peptidase